MGGTDEVTQRHRLRLGILGPLSATIDGVDVGLGGRRQQAVVAVLLLARGRLVGTDTLLDALWEGSPPPSGPAGLQSYISHLRRALEPDRAPRAPSTVLVSGGAGYRLALPDDDVDAWRFEDLVDRASSASDAATRVGLLREALALWRGPALADHAGAAWADAEARRLGEVREVARERLVAARLDGGESAIVVPEIEALLAQEPLREERWRLLALALYRAHRQADALDALRRARTMLAHELGVDPGPALRSLEAEVLAQSPALDAPPGSRPVTGPVGVEPRVPAQRVATERTGLVDRDAELAVLLGCLDDLRAGVPRVAVIEGPAGIGKTSLLQRVRDDARASGLTVLSARGSQLERDFGFGVVRQLVDPVLADPGAGDRLLAGAASGASRVFDATQASVEGPVEGVFALLHGLYWLTSNLAARGPLVLAVDDVQWCDTSSLRFLGYLARRLEGLPVLVVATWRTGEPYDDDELLHELTLGPDAVVVRPAPLSADGTRELVRSRLAGADPAFVSACFRTTSGNPLLLRQLLRALEAEGVRPDASHADTVRAIGSRAVSSLVLMRFRRMPEDNRTVARAVAVLGDGPTLLMVAAMTGLDEEAAATAIASLARSEVLRPDHPLGFVHPLVGAAVYDDLPVGERELQHERAWHVLAAAGSAPEQVAAHLLLVPPRGDGSVVDVLREAARRDAERGSADSAIGYLRRALAEPPRSADLPAVLTELGRLEATLDGPQALEHLARAYRLTDDPAGRADVAIMRARVAVFAGDPRESTRLAHEAVADLPDGLDDERQSLVALEHVSAYMHAVDTTTHPLTPAPPLSGDGPGARGLAAALCWEQLCRGEDRERVAELATFALEHRVLARTDPGLLWVVAANALALCGQDTRDLWESELQEAYRQGRLFAALATHLWLGYVQWQFGDLREALQSMAQCTLQNDLWGDNHVGQPYVDAISVQVLLDRGYPDEAQRVLDDVADTPRIGEGRWLHFSAHARLLATRGEHEAALAALDLAELEMQGVVNPAWRPWRTLRASTLAPLGRREEAVRLAEEELVLARRWGTPALVGKTLRVLGEVQGPDGADTLRDAVAHLARSPRRLEHARALHSLAGTLLDAPSTAGCEEARTAALEAHSLAGACAADGLRDEAAELLRRLGVDVPDADDVPLGLTQVERRVVGLVVEGANHTEIAQHLFVTPGTVTTIVEAVTQRLGVTTVDELRAALVRT